MVMPLAETPAPVSTCALLLALTTLRPTPAAILTLLLLPRLTAVPTPLAVESTSDSESIFAALCAVTCAVLVRLADAVTDITLTPTAAAMPTPLPPSPDSELDCELPWLALSLAEGRLLVLELEVVELSLT